MKQYLFLCLIFTLVASATAQNYSWQKLNTEKYPGKQDDIFFTDENTGWYVNGYGKIYHTSDAGTTWKLQLEKKGSFFRCVAFIDSLRGFVGTVGTDYFPNVTDTVPLYRTINGGRTWEPASYKGKTVKGLCAIDIVKEEFINHGEIGYKYHVFAVGRVGSPASIMSSHDDGATFTSMDMSKYCKAMFDIKMFNKREGLACAASDGDIEKSHARIIQTKDGGLTWKTVYESKRNFETTWKFHFPTDKIGYGTVQSYNPDTTVATQHFIKTVDGGAKWEEFILCKDFKARPFGVGFIDGKTGFIGTMKTGYQTADEGKTWMPTDMGVACNKIRVLHKPDGTLYGYAIGVSVLKLIDATKK